MAAVDLSVAERLCTHIDASPTPYHVVARVGDLLEAAGGRTLDERDAWPDGPGLWAVRAGGGLVAWRSGDRREAHRGFRIVAAHTDSPNLRIKPNPDRASAGFRQLGVDVYGGVLLNSWLDRDLGLSGRVAVRSPGGIREELVRIDRPILRIPQLAIHLDREVNEKGLLLNRQTHLSPVWGVGATSKGRFRELLAEGNDFAAVDILGWDLMLHDLQPSTIAGLDDEFLSAPRIDDLLSCFLAAEALVAVSDPGPRTPVVALFDHEEVGSVSSRGAAAPVLGRVLERITAGAGGGPEELGRAIADSVVLSADGAHATHPQLPRPSRTRAPDPAQCRTRAEGELESALRDRRRIGRRVRDGLRSGGCTPSDLRQPQRPRLRVDDRSRHRRPAGHLGRGCRLPPAGDALGPGAGR